MEKDMFIKRLEAAAKTVASWPEWKRDMLSYSASPERRNARPLFPDSDHETLLKNLDLAERIG